MRNLHKISNYLSDEIKLLIVNWHIQTARDSTRRVGKVQYKDGKFYIWHYSPPAGKYINKYPLSVSNMRNYLARHIPLSYFTDDMVL